MQCQYRNRRRIRLLRLPRCCQDGQVSLAMLPCHPMSMDDSALRAGVEEAGGSALVGEEPEPNQEPGAACWSSCLGEGAEGERTVQLHHSCMMRVWRL